MAASRIAANSIVTSSTVIGSMAASSTAAPSNTIAPRKVIKSDWSLWHPRLAHVSEHFTDYLYQVVNGVSQLKKPKTTKLAYEPCIKAKQIRIISRDPPRLVEDILECIYIDIWGPYSIPAFGKDGSTYFSSYTCEKSRYKWVRFQSTRSQLSNMFL